MPDRIITDEKLDWQARLEPFSALWLDVAPRFVDALADLDEQQLQQLILDCGQPTPTNCWWATFEIAPLLRRMAQRRLLMLRLLRAGREEGRSNA